MDNTNAKQELHNSDDLSVFSFCIDSKNDSGKFCQNESLTTKSNSTDNFKIRCENIKQDFSHFDPDDILSMVDFFVDARDFDSQTLRCMSLFSNDVDSDILPVINTCDKRYVRKGINLVGLKKARHLTKLRHQKIHKKLLLSTNSYLKQRTRTAFMGMDAACERSNDEKSLDRIRA